MKKIYKSESEKDNENNISHNKPSDYIESEKQKKNENNINNIIIYQTNSNENSLKSLEKTDVDLTKTKFPIYSFIGKYNCEDEDIFYANKIGNININLNEIFKYYYLFYN